MKTKVKNFFEIYDTIQEIGRRILNGVIEFGSVGSISPGSDGDYAFVDLNYHKYGEELTKNIRIPYELLEKKNKSAIDRFIREQITNFNIPF